MFINNYCRNYRVEKGFKLKQLGNVKTLSSFEHGRSSNINHLEIYIKLAIDLNDLDNFIDKLKIEVTKNYGN